MRASRHAYSRGMANEGKALVARIARTKETEKRMMNVIEMEMREKFVKV